MPIANPVTVSYPDFTGRLANAIIYPDPVSYPAISTVQVDTRYDSDNRTYVPSVSTTYIYPRTALLVSDIGSKEPNSSPFGDNSSLDAFGRLRVSAPTTLFDGKQQYSKMPWLYDEVTFGSASSVHILGDSSVLMSTAASGDYVIRQTTARFNYQPGKSQTAVMTGTFSKQTNIIKRVGQFQSLSAAPYTPTDGIYLEVTGTDVTLNILKSTGVTNTEIVSQSAWNVDPLDGTGPSGLTIDWNKAQIFHMDYEWLGVGRVRCGFYIAGKLYIAHQFTHFNTLTAPYITSPNQPIRYEIRQTGAGSGSMRHICSASIAEGVADVVGTNITADLSGAITNIDTTFRPVMAVRIAPGAVNLALRVSDVQLFNTGARNIQYRVWFNPTITGGSLTWLTAGETGLEQVQYAYGSSTLGLSGGYPLYSNFLGSGQGVAVSQASNAFLADLGRLGIKINGTPDTMVVAVRSLASTSDTWASINMLLQG